MNGRKRTFFLTFLLFFSSISVFAEADHVRIRTFVGMEPYGRMNVRNWDTSGEVQRWNVAYGITPGVEIFGVLGERVEIGAGFRYELYRRVFRSGGADDEKFSYKPLYVAGRFDIIESGGIKMYGIVRLGYTFLTANQAFKNIWLDEAAGLPLTDLSGGIYAGASLGVVFNLLEKYNWGLDWSMDAGYSYLGGTGRNSAGQGFPLDYQAFTVEFSLDWLF